MRDFTKAVLMFSFLLAATIGWAQGQPETAAHIEKNFLSKNVSVYPNPAVDVDYVEVKFQPLIAANIKLTLYNIIGNEIPAETEVIDDHKIRIRVKDFAAGYYLIALHDEETQFKGTFKFLKR
jgi:hypothetical protein